MHKQIAPKWYQIHEKSASDTVLERFWAPSWRQDTAKATPGPEFNEKYSISSCPVGSKMEPKSKKHLYKNYFQKNKRKIYLLTSQDEPPTSKNIAKR